MKIRDLVPGDRVPMAGPGSGSATFVGSMPHPLYPGFLLVVWRLADRSWSHDALLPDQDMPEPAVQATPDARETALRAALAWKAGDES